MMRLIMVMMRLI